MNSIEEKINRIETRLQKLVEGSAAILAPQNAEFKKLTKEILEVFSKNIRIDAEGKPVAPDGILLYINPEQSEYWESNQAVLDSLSVKLQEFAGEEGIQFMQAPVIRTELKANVLPGETQVEVLFRTSDIQQTAAVQIEGIPNTEKIPGGAYLILDGIDVFNLEQTIINIGRNRDNQLVLNDPRISRRHAQLRAVKDQFILFDLDSSGGTFVNGERIQTKALQSGDVISLAGIPLIYGQDSPETNITQNISLE